MVFRLLVFHRYLYYFLFLFHLDYLNQQYAEQLNVNILAQTVTEAMLLHETQRIYLK